MSTYTEEDILRLAEIFENAPTPAPSGAMTLRMNRKELRKKAKLQQYLRAHWSYKDACGILDMDLEELPLWIGHRGWTGDYTPEIVPLLVKWRLEIGR